jgi:hypothetical protein
MTAAPKVSLSAAAVSRRLEEASAASNLSADRRLDTKIDLSPEGVSHRLHEASSLYALCQSLRALPGGATGHS